ncbi:MAG: hypothetical protein Q4B29_00700 [Candidatus Saccharibacteria bacterium]|nr:hypothetical protein [Candidatus Saccharibacteria bacterium]
MERNKKKKSKTDWLGSIGLTLILMAAVLMIWFFLNGQTTTTGEYTSGERNASLSCVREGENYPIFTFDRASDKKTEIKVLFAGDNLQSVSLTQTLSYADSELAEGSRAHNHGAMNKSYVAAGLKPDVISDHFSVLEDNKMVMTLYAAGADFEGAVPGYFLAEGVSENPSVEDFSKEYVSRGFNCVITE